MYSISTSKSIESFVLDHAIDLLDMKKINWTKTPNIKINNIGNKLLNFTLHSSDNSTVYNRISTELHIEKSNKIPVLLLTFATNSSVGNPTFIVEVRNTMHDNNTKSALQIEPNIEKGEDYIWSASLGNTLGYNTTRVYQLPFDVNNSDIQVRFYIISNNTTEAYTKLENSTLFNL